MNIGHIGGPSLTDETKYNSAPQEIKAKVSRLPDNVYGEPPEKVLPHETSDVNGGERLSESSELVHFKREDGLNCYAVVRYCHFRTEYGERFEAHVRVGDDLSCFYERSRYNRVQIIVEPARNVAWLGPTGWIIMDHTVIGTGLASYLLCAVLTWLQEHFPDVQISPGWLSPQDGDEKNRHRRDAFYRRQGFYLFYSDPESGNGKFWAPRASVLIPKWNDEKVARVSLTDAANIMIVQGQTINNLNVIRETNQTNIRKLKKARALNCLLILLAFVMFGGIIVIFKAGGHIMVPHLPAPT